MASAIRRFWDNDKHLPCNQTPWGQLVAVDVNTGDVVYRKTLGVTEQFPAGQQDTGRPGLGGTTVTATGLTFVGATDDLRFRAFETATGENLWEPSLNASAESHTYHLSGCGRPPVRGRHRDTGGRSRIGGHQ